MNASPRHVPVLEYGFLFRAREGRSASGTRLAAKDYDWLKSLLVEPEALDEGVASHRLLRLCNKDGEEALQVLNHVGVLETPGGTQIEILPKIGLAPDAARNLLVKMLRRAGRLPVIPVQAALLRPLALPLMELFFREFLEAVGLLLKKGIASGYVRQESNEPYLRGRLMVVKQLRTNLRRPDRFYVTNERFIPDRPENRLLRAVLDIAAAGVHEPGNQRLCRELLFAFEDIAPLEDVRRDLDACVKDRSLAHYDTALAWARVILMRLSPLAAQGGLKARAILFPMEKVFEQYVAACLADQVERGCRVRAQAASRYFVTHQGAGMFRLQPDIVIERGGKPLLVLDTKWKLIDASLSGARDKYGLSQADFYQMYAYGQRYLDAAGERTVVLVYPGTEAFAKPLQVFEFEAGFRLMVVPFDLQRGVLLMPLDEPLKAAG